MNKNLDVMEDIKQDITDNQYKTIMESLMAINKDPIMCKNHRSNKFICLFEWLDTQIVITDTYDVTIKEETYLNLLLQNIIIIFIMKI